MIKNSITKVLLLVPPVVAFPVVTIGAPSDAKAPLLALISATALCIGFIPTPQTSQGSSVHFAVLVVAYVSGVAAAFYWLGTVEQLSPFWYVVALLVGDSSCGGNGDSWASLREFLDARVLNS